MSMDQLRKAYDVPAKRGGRIEFTDSNGAKWRGIIRSSRYARLRVSLDGLRTISILHPTWNIKYL
jgi:hypothetical protein